MEKLGLKPYSFDDKRADELIALAHDLHGPTLPSTPQTSDQVFAIANYLTDEPHRFKKWLADAAPWYCEDDADELLERLNRKRYRFRSTKLAQLFDVTWERKKRLGLETIIAKDTPADMIEAAKRRQRERDQQYHHKQRRRLGMKIRTKSASQPKPPTEQRLMGDPWQAMVATCINEQENISVTEVLQGLGVEVSQVAMNRAARCLRALGWKRYRARNDQQREWRYRRGLGPSRSQYKTSVERVLLLSTGLEQPRATQPPNLPTGHTAKKSAGRRGRSNGAPHRQRRASGRWHTKEESAGHELVAKPSSSLQWSSCGQAAKTEERASLEAPRWASTLGMGSSGAGVDSRVWRRMSPSKSLSNGPSSEMPHIMVSADSARKGMCNER
jgi:hypothetical protein